LAGLFVVAMLNAYTAYPSNEFEKNNSGIEAATEDFDVYKEIGWPFRFHRSGTILHIDEVFWTELIADIAIAVCISNVTGAVFYFIALSLMNRLPARTDEIE
jgi:hypothetical protein